MKKRKRWVGLFYFCCTLFSFFILSFTGKAATAYFNDSADVAAGMKLSLGTVTIESDILQSETPIIIQETSKKEWQSFQLRNTGTLDGKLAYKVEILDQKGHKVSKDALSDLALTIELEGKQSIPLNTDTDEYQFLLQGKTPMKLNKEEKIKGILTGQVKERPQKDERWNIHLTFLLLQTNAKTPEEQMFYDTTTIKQSVTIKSKEEKPEDQGDWPPDDSDQWVKVNDQIRYNTSRFEPMIYFSNTQENKAVGLNQSVLFIEIAPSVSYTDFKFTSDQQQLVSKVEQVGNDSHKLKVTLSLNPNVLPMNLFKPKNSNYYRLSFYYGKHSAYCQIDSIHNNLGIDLAKVLVSSDQRLEEYDRTYKEIPIYLFGEPKDVFLQLTNNGEQMNMTKPFETISLPSHVKTKAEISGENAGLVELISKNKSGFHLRRKTKDSTAYNEGLQFDVALIGNAGKPMHLSRPIELLPYVEDTRAWPGVNKKQAVLYRDEKGIKSDINTLEAVLSEEEIDGVPYFINEQILDIFVFNPEKEKLDVKIKNSEEKGDGFYFKEQTYSSDGSIMKVSLGYASNKPINPYYDHRSFTYQVLTSARKHTKIEEREIQVNMKEKQ
ncbi:hypothetical protein [Pisciglobus halotolerans]|uniref:Uncharacterized protein n=1 Tax=Pisciglobus halotolerans TaxID=745365 RepID=A0A1I3D2N2_9LACT|nr:hypothetical protein [Pisciglobus halotolerans]SFH80972.1 hypothetical protein SAMN04489868_12720 [Pisciglobus halotolerans]